jgi:hypothetical protein
MTNQSMYIRRCRDRALLLVCLLGFMEHFLGVGNAYCGPQSTHQVGIQRVDQSESRLCKVSSTDAKHHIPLLSHLQLLPGSIQIWTYSDKPCADNAYDLFLVVEYRGSRKSFPDRHLSDYCVGIHRIQREASRPRKSPSDKQGSLRPRQKRYRGKSIKRPKALWGRKLDIRQANAFDTEQRCIGDRGVIYDLSHNFLVPSFDRDISGEVGEFRGFRSNDVICCENISIWRDKESASVLIVPTNKDNSSSAIFEDCSWPYGRDCIGSDQQRQCGNKNQSVHTASPWEGIPYYAPSFDPMPW